MRIERDPAFWTAVAAAPEVRSGLMGLAPEQIGALAANEAVLPLAAAHGGFLFARMDGFGFAFEVHTLFTRAGWGREAVSAGFKAVGFLFDSGAALIVTYEVAGNPRSRAPRGFGFVPAGGWRETAVGPLRPWILTKAAWDAERDRRAPCQRPS